ncbi:MAG: LexA family transcriptional regulator [Porphyromonadaceae bacterium]|nr:LexA family transcriptional regulator [Porphyromonadaceae bacterium]
MGDKNFSALAEYFKSKGVTQLAIAEKLGVSKAYVNALMTGKKAFGKSQAAKWSSEFGISASWLLTGDGDMFTTSSSDKQSEVKREEEEYELLPRITEDKGRPYYDVDFLGGYGEFADDPASAPVTYMIDYPPYNKEGVFYMNVRGDSMSPEINSGDLVALRPIEAWYDFLLLGKVYAIVTLSGQRTIKRLRRGSDSEHYTLEPINPAYESQEIPKTQIERVFEVLGGIRRYE